MRDEKLIGAARITRFEKSRRLSEKFFKIFVHKASIFNDGLECIRVYLLMIWDGYSMHSIRHTEVFTLSYNPESYFTECPDSPFGGDISKEHD
jgi:hypothetical protein